MSAQSPTYAVPVELPFAVSQYARVALAESVESCTVIFDAASGRSGALGLIRFLGQLAHRVVTGSRVPYPVPSAIWDRRFITLFIVENSPWREEVLSQLAVVDVAGEVSPSLFHFLVSGRGAYIDVLAPAFKIGCIDFDDGGASQAAHIWRHRWGYAFLPNGVS